FHRGPLNGNKLHEQKDAGINRSDTNVPSKDVEVTGIVSIDFTPEGRIVWVEIEGIPFKLWSGNTFKRIAAKWGELLDVDDQEKMCFHSKRLCLYTKSELFGWRLKDGDPKVQDVGSCRDDNNVAEVPETLFEESIGQKEKQSKDPFGFTPNDYTNEFCMNEENVRSVNDDNPQ
nr:glucose-methanol-choline oxidoreductase, FAD/NAD(P)-binding domain protein [Tanacetum cinerariifolium]